MSARQPGHDEQGRPIVAELGRAETPQEAAERRAAASKRHRSSQTTLNLVIALVASLGVVALLIMIVVRPDQGPLAPPTDYRSAAAAAQSTFDEPLLVPDLPDDWRANRAEIDTGSDGIRSWQVGFVTPAQQYISTAQGIDANPTWVAAQIRDAKAVDTMTIGGVEWAVHDRRDADDIGNVGFALVAEVGRSTIVIAGTAGDAEFETIATAIAKEIR